MAEQFPLGRYLHLAPLKPAALPSHPAFDRPENAKLQSKQTPRLELSSFVRDVLDEAYRFVDDRAVKTFSKKGTKSLRPAAAQIELKHQKILRDSLRHISRENAKLSPPEFEDWPKADEEWFSRRSVHADRAEGGTASWEELKGALYASHSENEGAYTDDIYDTHLVLDWVDQVRGLNVNGYHGVDMRIFEMCHKMPVGLLQPRVFSVLVLCALKDVDSFIVVQIPVDVSELDEALYSNGKNLQHGYSSQKRKKIVLGLYTSIERCRYVTGNDGSKATDWMMATTSDAKGVLPMSIQTPNIPGAIAKDVGFVIDWCNKQRKAS